jgi:5'-nucleotidase
MNKKILYLDLDGVIADFKGKVNSKKEWKKSKRPDLIPNIYRDLELMPGALEAVEILIAKFDVYILSSPSWDNYESWTHKRLWVEKHFANLLRRRLILCNNKSLLKGDYLIDDHSWNGAKEFEGKWIHFGTKEYPNWNTVLKFMRNE